MIEKGRFLAAAFITAEAFLHLTQPASASECIPLSQIHTNRHTIHFVDRDLDLPEGYILRAIFPSEPITVRSPEPCFEDPTFMINVPVSDGYPPYILVRRDGRVIHEEPENEEDPFASLKALLPQQEVSSPEE